MKDASWGEKISKQHKPHLGMALIALSTAMLNASTAQSHFLGPSKFQAKRSEHSIAVSACGSIPKYSKQDIFFGGGALSFFYISKSQCLSASGKRFCSTYLVSDKGNICYSHFYSEGNPQYDDVLNIQTGEVEEVITLSTPTGKVQLRNLDDSPSLYFLK